VAEYNVEVSAAIRAFAVVVVSARHLSADSHLELNHRPHYTPKNDAY
jgi:hypothetical protein